MLANVITGIENLSRMMASLHPAVLVLQCLLQRKPADPARWKTSIFARHRTAGSSLPGNDPGKTGRIPAFPGVPQADDGTVVTATSIMMLVENAR
jgi:hypothetical protein